MPGIKHKTLTSELGGGKVSATQWDEAHDIESLPLVGLTADPASPADGESWYRSDLGLYRAKAGARVFSIPAPGGDMSISTDTTVAAADNGKTFSATASLTITLPTAPEVGFAIQITATNAASVTLAPGSQTVQGGNVIWPGTAVDLIYAGGQWRRYFARGFGIGTVGAIGILPDAANPDTPAGLWQITSATANINFLPAFLTGYPLLCRIERLNSGTTSQTIYDPVPTGSGVWARCYGSGAWSALGNGGAIAALPTTSLPTGVAVGAVVWDTTISQLVAYDGAAWGADAAAVHAHDWSDIASGIPAAVASLSGVNTGDQTITLSGDVTGSGAGAIAVTLAATGVNPTTFGSATSSARLTIDAKGRVTAGSTLTITPAWPNVTGKPTTLAGYAITDAQPLDGDLTSLAAASATGAMYYRSAADTWSPVTIGANLTFAAGTLAAAGGGGGGVTDGDYGAIIVSGSGTVWDLDYPAVNAVVEPVWANVTGTPTTLAGYGVGDALWPHQVAPSGGRQQLQRYSSLSAGAGTAANLCRMGPILLPLTRVLTGCEINVTTAAAGNAKIVIYATGADGYPSTLVAESADADTSTTGVKTCTFASAVTLTAGVQYWIGVRMSAAPILTTTVGAVDISGATSFLTSAASCVSRTITYASGAPSPWVWTASEITNNREPFLIRGIVQ